jgi:NTE family protein
MSRIEVQQIRPEQIQPPIPDESDFSSPPHGSGKKPPPPPAPPAEPIDLERNRVKVIWLLQFAIFIGVIALWAYVGVSVWMGATAVIVFGGSLLWLGWLMWRETVGDRVGKPLDKGSVLLWHMKWGVRLTFVAILLLAWALFLRIDWTEYFWGGVFLLGILLIVEFLTFPFGRFAIQNQVTPWFQFAVGVTFIPLLIAWLAATLVSWAKPRPADPQMLAKLEQSRAAEVVRREECATNTGWQKTNGDPITVGVALSGGGYRAAAIHAGLLQALDNACTPIRYLSTVSGGSIIGTWYALGYTPKKFRDEIKQKKPGLADDILSIFNVFLDWFWPGWSSADIYARHFKNTFFHSKTLANTLDKPLLLINATDVVNSEREVFYKGRTSPDKTVDPDATLLAELVAASGAFPGVFQPKTIQWTSSQGDKIELRRFIDGGVFENLGLTGLSRYFSPAKLKVDILILSDASMQIQPKTFPEKVQILDLLERSQSITYQHLHQTLYKLLQKDGDAPKCVVAILATREENFSKLSGLSFPNNVSPPNGSKVAKDVASLRTLKELDPDEVEKAFWVGQTLGEIYWKEIDGMRQKLAAGSGGCSA